VKEVNRLSLQNGRELELVFRRTSTVEDTGSAEDQVCSERCPK